MPRRPKVTIVGAGMTGASAAQWCAARELGDVVLQDVIEGLLPSPGRGDCDL
jgi:malate dehydrogenase